MQFHILPNHFDILLQAVGLLSYIILGPKCKCHLCPYCCSNTARSCVRHILVGGCSNFRTTAIEVLILYNVLAQYCESGSNCSKVQGWRKHTRNKMIPDDSFSTFKKERGPQIMFYPAPEFERHLR